MKWGGGYANNHESARPENRRMRKERIKVAVRRARRLRGRQVLADLATMRNLHVAAVG